DRVQAPDHRPQGQRHHRAIPGLRRAQLRQAGAARRTGELAYDDRARRVRQADGDPARRCGAMTLRKVCLGALLGLAWLPAMSQDVAPLGPVNIAPEVTLDAPANGQQFVTGTTITLWASAFDMDDPLPTVQFLVDGAVVGTAYPGNYSVDWVVTAGSHTVAAKAADARNKSTTTPAITITGVANQAPSVSL